MLIEKNVVFMVIYHAHSFNYANLLLGFILQALAVIASSAITEKNLVYCHFLSRLFIGLM